MDSRKRRDGAAIEELGWYNPIDSDQSFDMKDDRIIHWLKEGAIPTKAAQKLFRRSGISHRWHLMNQGLDEDTIQKEMKKWSLNRDDVLKKREQRSKEKEQKQSKELDQEADSIEQIDVNKVAEDDSKQTIIDKSNGDDKSESDDKKSIDEKEDKIENSDIEQDSNEGGKEDIPEHNIDESDDGDTQNTNDDLSDDDEKKSINKSEGAEENLVESSVNSAGENSDNNDFETNNGDGSEEE